MKINRLQLLRVMCVFFLFLITGIISPAYGEQAAYSGLYYPPESQLQIVPEFLQPEMLCFCSKCCIRPNLPECLFGGIKCPRCCMVQPYCAGPTTVVVIRHGEKACDNCDALSSDGLARAAELVHVAGDTKISAIYTTDTQRTKKTVANLASRLNLNPIIYDDYATLKNWVLSGHKSQTVLVAGHSDTIDSIITTFGGRTNSCPVAYNEFDNFCVITIGCDSRDISVLHLHYGVKT